MCASKLATALFVVPLALAGFAFRASAVTRIDLNGDWNFCPDPSGRGQADGWWKRMPDGTKIVTVPNTWNVGELEDYEGIAWYFKTIDIPSELRGRHLEIHFEATFYRARIWLNGEELGRHDGGHTPYYFVLPPNLPEKNFLAVAIDNRPTTTSIPGLAFRLETTRNLWYDWWHYGGIVRDVWLSVNDLLLLRRQHIRVKLQGKDAVVTDRLFLENVSNQASSVTLNLQTHLEGGAPAATAERTVTLAPGRQELEVELRIPEAQLWHFDHPNLYDLDADLIGPSGRLIDSLSDHFGVRTIEIRDDKLYLNGEPVRLVGMTRHEDSPTEGLAETAGTWRRDYDDMKNLGVVLTRPVHYPQLPAILDYCDRNGILLIPEIPLWQMGRTQLGDAQLRALARQMLGEMIDEDFNHPSIIAWSVANECDIHSAEGIEYVRQMREWEKSLDPDRYVTFADDLLPGVNDASKSASQYADFLMWNQYFGTWHGPANLLVPTIEHIHETFPGKMIIISEFGAASIFTANSAEGDALRAHTIREQLAEFAKHDFIAGAIFWCYQDYRSHRNLWPGQTKGYVEMGLVNENRQRRPSYSAWNEAASPVRVEVNWTFSKQYPYPPTGFQARFERRGADELPSYELRGYRVSWELHNASGEVIAHSDKVLGDIGASAQMEEQFPSASSHAWKLNLGVIRPTGFAVLEKEISWNEPLSGGEDRDETRRKGTYPANPPILETTPLPNPR